MKTLAICDSKKEYMSRLKKRLNLKSGLPFEIITFDSLDIFIKSFYKTKPDILLMEEKLINEYLCEVSESDRDTVVLIALTEEEYYENCINEEKSEISFIGRYHSAEIIKNQILQIVSEKISDNVSMNTSLKNSTAKIIGFYSPVRRVRQTDIAMCMGVTLSENYKCLYLNLNAFPQKIEYSESFEGTDKNLADLVFVAANKSGSFKMKLESMKKMYKGMDYILGVDDYRDIIESDIDDILNLIIKIEDNGLYDYILLDITDDLPGFINVLNKCTGIYSFYDNECDSVKVITQYRENLNVDKTKDLYSKTKFEIVPDIHLVPGREKLEGYVRGLCEKNGD